MLSPATGQCKTQTAGYCFYHANEYVTTVIPLFSIRSLHFTLPCPATVDEAVSVLLADSLQSNEKACGGAVPHFHTYISISHFLLSL